MTDRTCPLGEDCDLTVAWMAGREEARDQFRARIEQLETQLGLARIDADQQRARAEAAEAALQAADELAQAVDDLIAQSTGVSGLHMNGDLAPWEELVEGGRFEEWLAPLAAYRRATGGGT